MASARADGEEFTALRLRGIDLLVTACATKLLAALAYRAGLPIIVRKPSSGLLL